MHTCHYVYYLFTSWHKCVGDSYKLRYIMLKYIGNYVYHYVHVGEGAKGKRRLYDVPTQISLNLYLISSSLMQVKYYLYLISTTYILAELIEGLNSPTPFVNMQ